MTTDNDDLKREGTLKAVIGGQEMKTAARMMYLLREGDIDELSRLARVEVVQPLKTQFDGQMKSSLGRYRPGPS